MIDDTNKEVNEDEVTDAGESNEDVTSEAVPAGLTINDLANIKQIVDVASARGAFRANEMQVVGGTYDRLVAFLSSLAPATDRSVTEDEDEATEEASA